MTSTKIIKKSLFYKVFSDWLAEGLLTSEGERNNYLKIEYICLKNDLTEPKYSKRRRIITPAFHFKILEQYVEIFNGQCEHLMNTLSAYKENDKIHLQPILALYSLDVICG